ncbi:MAG: hypothetical protein AVDCRST_MAG76-705 [uncultured Acidimicrobiales bacterium]|uniref:Uncharacterized protein n=1 Tax=uncultured Acidimicrobiales bacterium TaxID=310071 RepID=A0A6J4HE12_9ACTN|nr:MAG: hypothetical protein AVDCRST_MAG76-705 [uncultured Acidimicrobiales bacterium]
MRVTEHQRRVTDELLVLDLCIECILTFELLAPRKVPHDVVGEAVRTRSWSPAVT